MNKPRIPNLVDLREIARISGEIARNYFLRQKLGNSTKSDGTPISEADQAIHDFIVNDAHNHYPSIRVLSEEGVAGNPDSSWTLVVDPIDGTIPFISAIPIFSICLALLDADMIPTLGVIYDPIMDRSWYAAKNSPAYLNGRKIKTCQKPHLKGAQIHMSNWHGSPPLCDLDKLQKELFDCEVGVMSICSGAYPGALVANGKMDAGMSMIRKGWEAAALHVIVPAAGGVITDAYGEPLTYGPHAEINGYVVSANQELHNQIMHIMNRCRYPM